MWGCKLDKSNNRELKLNRSKARKHILGREVEDSEEIKSIMRAAYERMGSVSPPK